MKKSDNHKTADPGIRGINAGLFQEPIQTDFIKACQPNITHQFNLSAETQFHIFTLVILIVLLACTLIATNKTKAVIDKTEQVLASTITSEAVIAPTVTPTPTEVPIVPVMETRIFKITAYCSCVKCCKKSDGITATGVKVQEGVTCAADWSVLAPGSVVDIDGIGVRIVQDKGSAVKGDHIDLFVSSHAQATKFGVQYKRVTILKEGK